MVISKIISLIKSLFYIFPTKEQWKKWTLPSKLTAIGVLVGISSIILTLIINFIPNRRNLKILEPEIQKIININLPNDIKLPYDINKSEISFEEYGGTLLPKPLFFVGVKSANNGFFLLHHS